MRAAFTGIAGGEVALHKLGIHMRAVVSVEILDDVRAAMARKFLEKYFQNVLFSQQRYRDVVDIDW